MYMYNTGKHMHYNYANYKDTMYIYLVKSARMNLRGSLIIILCCCLLQLPNLSWVHNMMLGPA